MRPLRLINEQKKVLYKPKRLGTGPLNFPTAELEADQSTRIARHANQQRRAPILARAKALKQKMPASSSKERIKLAHDEIVHGIKIKIPRNPSKLQTMYARAKANSARNDAVIAAGYDDTGKEFERKSTEELILKALNMVYDHNENNGNGLHPDHRKAIAPALNALHKVYRAIKKK